jgi:hypothetical protein
LRGVSWPYMLALASGRLRPLQQSKHQSLTTATLQ